MEPYYYHLLSKEQQEVYRLLKDGLHQLASEIPVKKMELKEINEVFFLLRLDDPSIFYVDSLKYQTRVNSEHFTIIPEYTFSKQDILTQRTALKKRIERLVEPLKNKSDLEKEKAIHDFICENVHYDKLKKTYSHEIIGPLGHNTGVCEGISKAVKILCDHLKLDCLIVVCYENLEKGIKYRHAWNLVKIDGQYYHLDCTFDNTMKDKLIRYDYFNLNDKEIFLDHEPSIYKIPAVNKSGSYYVKNKLAFDDYQKAVNRCLQNLKKNRPFAFKWLGSNENVIELYKALFESYKDVKVVWNKRQRIIEVYQNKTSQGLSENEFSFL